MFQCVYVSSVLILYFTINIIIDYLVRVILMSSVLNGPLFPVYQVTECVLNCFPRYLNQAYEFGSLFSGICEISHLVDHMVFLFSLHLEIYSRARANFNTQEKLFSCSISTVSKKFLCKVLVVCVCPTVTPFVPVTLKVPHHSPLVQICPSHFYFTNRNL